MSIGCSQALNHSSCCMCILVLRMYELQMCAHVLYISSNVMAADPEDWSSTGRYNVTFRQTVFTDGDEPENTALSYPILIDITNDDIFEGVEYFQARIVETFDSIRVGIGQDTVNITITDSESCMFGMGVSPYHSTAIVC